MDMLRERGAGGGAERGAIAFLCSLPDVVQAFLGPAAVRVQVAVFSFGARVVLAIAIPLWPSGTTKFVES